MRARSPETGGQDTHTTRSLETGGQDARTTLVRCKQRERLHWAICARGDSRHARVGDFGLASSLLVTFSLSVVVESSRHAGYTDTAL